MDAVERIEISVRAALSNAIAAAPWRALVSESAAVQSGTSITPDSSTISSNRSATRRRTSKRRDIYIEHYYQTYSTPDMPPSWMVFESLNFGTVSFAYMNLAAPRNLSPCAAAMACRIRS